MTEQDARFKYEQQGLTVVVVEDEPGEKYELHRHEAVCLYTLSGSAEVRLDEGQWRAMQAGDEVEIGNNQLHEVVVRTAGWKYLFAASAGEVARQGL